MNFSGRRRFSCPTDMQEILVVPPWNDVIAFRELQTSHSLTLELAVPPVRLLAAVAVTFSMAHAPAEPPDAKGREFFEKKIRPILIEHCYSCHSAEAAAKKKLRGGLQLDTREGLIAGGETGPAINRDKPADSLLLKCLNYDGDIKMPPKGKLPAAAIRDVETWLAMGAPDPRTAGPAKRPTGMTIEEGRNFWAYVPPKMVPPPVVNDAQWPANDIDRFILAKLEAANLKPNRDADRMTLARRVAFDLTGLPLSPDDVDSYVNDSSPKAYEQLVDRLLSSPAFGERWGRHWLDVARYAESVTLRGFVFKDAWRYRDYVIASMNKDVPFDQFIRQQIAGDLLPYSSPAERERNLIATTYLMLGNTNLEEQDKKQLRMDFVDEQLDVITKGFLAQTVTCARCHDHKFDPIPTTDYYALAGILRNVKTMEHANVSAWTEVPLPADAETERLLTEKEKRIAALQAKIKSAKALASKTGSPKGAMALRDVPGIAVDDAQAKKVGTWQDSTANGTFIGPGYTHDQNSDKGKKTITFTPTLPADGRYEVRLAYSPGTNRATNVPVTVFGADGEKEFTVDMKKTPPLEGRFLSLGTYKFEKAGQSFVIVSNEGTNGHVTADCVVFLPADVADPSSKTPVKVDDQTSDDVAKLEAELKAVQAAGPFRAKAMAPVEESKIEETFVHIRGSVHTLGAPTPRGVLTVATRGRKPVFPKDQSGRLQLADWIAAADNPLTARVIVNRTWHWLLGTGLVRSTDNFGTTGERPSHPELLDYLAMQFVRNGWSLKTLIREIVLSRTYQLSSERDPKSNAISKADRVDPDNRLLSRAHRKRLEAEAIRDSILVAAGTLDRSRGGAGFPQTLASDYGFTTTSTRRSVYLPIFRNSLPEALDAFDAADASTVTGNRNASTVAPQALYFLNSPFVHAQAKHTAVRILTEPDMNVEKRVAFVYRLLLGRPPREGERDVAVKYVMNAGPQRADAWAALVQSLMASADFRYVD
jgi:cytochrome c553